MNKYVLVGAVALIIGLMLGMFAVAVRPIEPPAIVPLQPITADIASRRFVVVDPHKKEVVLFESMGAQLKEVSRSKY